MGAIISTIGNGLVAIIGALSKALIAIVELVTIILVTVVDIVWDIVCCRCCGSRASESRRQLRRDRLAAESTNAAATPAKG
ncbi:hypothetical protein C8F01DRAFT_1149050 [Mycena amicta]|nr:hypothetical protein C8F01DRAFT_1149050 [Mycena amicta]